MLAELVRYFHQGGLMMWPLLLLAVLTAVLAGERVGSLRRARIDVTEFLSGIRKALLVDRDTRAAIAMCERSRGPVAAVVKAALTRYGRPPADIERTVEAAAAFEGARLERGLLILSVAANVAPLIGFLGTVIGMIKAMSALGTAGLSNPVAVATGISEALIAAAAGLVIAIPAQLAHTYLVGEVDRFLGDIEVAANLLMETVSETLPERAGPAVAGA
jgi:biopolymer transport protein ExbB